MHVIEYEYISVELMIEWSRAQAQTKLLLLALTALASSPAALFQAN